MSFFGNLLSEIRRERMITIEKLSDMSGIETSDILSAEEGTGKLPFSSFVKLFFALSANKIFTSKVSVCRASDLEIDENPDNGLNYYPLAGGVVNQRMTPFIIQLTDDKWSDQDLESGGENFVYVLSGEVEIKYGEKTYHLTQGDSMYFGSATNRSVRNLTECGSKLLMVVC